MKFMEDLRPKIEQVKSALWKSKLGSFLSALQTKINQDSLAEHEESARKRNNPAHFDRVQKLRRQERRAHHDPWAK